MARLHGWLAVLVCLVLCLEAEAQGRRGRGRSTARDQQQAWTLPKENPVPLPPLPGFEPLEKSKSPPGPKPKEKAKTPPKPPDPMKEADQVTAAAEYRAALEKAEAQLLAEHFRVCDLDASGWLSLREVEMTLSLDRGDFRRMDTSQDGRLDAAEFARQGQQLLARLGAATAAATGPEPPPEPPSDPAAAASLENAPEVPAPLERATPVPEVGSLLGSMPVRPRDLLARYDGDQSGGLDAVEIQKLFLEAGLVLSSELVVAQMDPDDSGQLEQGELVAIAWIVSRHVPEALRPAPEPSAPAAEATEPEPTAVAPQAPAHFGLLDPDADGYIDEADLRALQSPSRLDLRFRALLSAMDRDGDGRLSPAEFQASMGAGPR